MSVVMSAAALSTATACPAAGAQQVAEPATPAAASASLPPVAARDASSAFGGRSHLASDKWMSVSCASASFCVSIGAGGEAFDNDGVEWRSLPNAGTGTNAENFSSISCPSASTCFALDLSMEVVAYANGSWGSPLPLIPAEEGTVFMGASISCASSRFCAVVDGAGDAVVYTGGTWGRARRVTRYGITSVSCPRAGYCVAVDSDGDALRYANGAWTRPQRVDSLAVPTSVSCTSPRRCVALLGSEFGGSYAMTFNGSRWSTPTLIAGKLGGAGDELERVSCASVSFCVAVGGNGAASIYDGRDWHDTRFADERNNTAGVSCPTASRCVIVDSNGNAYAYTR
ncbi:MAG TPA: hypothetical protein VFC22_05745 [Solirubrobacteraceae bacterium]|nr:hypothetical protein [Solirubrobacteraceae bacterium]